MDWWNRCTFVDDMMLGYGERRWPQHSIRVINRRGISVCGVDRPNAAGRITLIEYGERDWGWCES